MQSNIIYFYPQRFYSFNFYNNFLIDLASFYKNTKNNKIPPELSFEKLEYIDPIVIPNIISIGLYLKNYHNKKINLKLDYNNSKLLFFLERINFFKIVGDPNANPYISPKGLGIFNFIENLTEVGIDQKQRKEHKVYYYLPDNVYQKVTNDEDLIKYRDDVIEDLDYVISSDYEEIFLNDLEIQELDSIELFDIFNEIISNSKIHSNSISFSVLHTNKYRTALAISDIGIGFEQSLKNKKNFEYENIEKFTILNNYKKSKKEPFKESLKDFYIIFDILFFSMTKIRKGLFDLIFPIVSANGTIRIHYNSTQVTIKINYLDDITKLDKIRKQLRDVLINIEEIKYLIKTLNDKESKEDNKSINKELNEAKNELNELMIKKENYISESKDNIIILCDNIKKNFNPDKFISPLRIFDVVFKGVHIEIEFK